MKFKLLFLVLLACFFSAVALAADADPNQAPEWLAMVLSFLQTVPYVGPYLVTVLKWLGVLASVMTAVSTAAMIALKALEGAVVWAGWAKGEAAVEWLQKNVLPKLQWFSVYNVQKKPA